MTVPTSTRHEPENESTVRVGYYGVPVIHEPHWKWLVIGYFFFGGISGSAAVIGAYVQLFGGPSIARIGRHAAYVSMIALAPCPLLLILDLGRPSRFLNMLRAFRPSSPMSLGTWGLTAFGLLCTLSAALHLLHDLAGRADGGAAFSKSSYQGPTLLASLNCLAGLFVAGYTGVLLAATAVPLWSKRPGLLGPLFLSSAMTSGAAALTASTHIWPSGDHRAEDALQRFETISTLIEGVLLLSWLSALGPTAKPLTQGLMGYVVRNGVAGVGIALPLTISAISHLLPSRFRRSASLASAALTLTGVFALRYAVVEGGRRSANDPLATIEMTG